jgi:hypothetical protein
VSEYRHSMWYAHATERSDVSKGAKPAVAAGCRCWLLPLLTATAGCRCRLPLLTATAGCDCWLQLLTAGCNC